MHHNKQKCLFWCTHIGRILKKDDRGTTSKIVINQIEESIIMYFPICVHRN